MAQSDFSLGIGYWPRSRSGAPFSWLNIDYAALDNDLSHIAALGIDTLRLDLRWEEFQPAPRRIGGEAMRHFERTLDTAQAHGLRVAAGLLSASLAGTLALPRWATGLRPDDALGLQRLVQPPPLPAEELTILSGEGYHRDPPRDLFADNEQQTAQAYAIREVVGYFATHPALWGWQLAADLTLARPPASAAAAAAWWAALADQARRFGARHVLGQVNGLSLARPATLRPEAIVRAGAAVVITARPAAPLPLRETGQAGLSTFLLALVAALAMVEQSRPVPLYVADIGPGLAVEGRAGPVDVPAFGTTVHEILVDEEQQALDIETALNALYRAGASGIWLTAYNDPSPAAWAGPPLDQSLTRRLQGLVAANGRERPAAAALRAFAARLGQGMLARTFPPRPLPLDPEQYWRNPQAMLQELFLAGA